MTLLVIGVDPGDSMGVGALRQDGLLPTLTYAAQGDPHHGMDAIELLLQHHAQTHTCVIACERYVNFTSRHRTHQPVAQQVMGATEHLAKRYDATFVLQAPADAWAVAPNHLLHQLGMWQTAKTVDAGDANDANMAIRHALVYLMRSHNTLFDALLRHHNVKTS